MSPEDTTSSEMRRLDGDRVRISRATAYVLAVAVVAITLILTECLGVRARADFTALYVLAVLVVSSLGGLGPGLVATLLSGTAIAFAQVGWRIRPDLGWDDTFRVTLFILAAVVVSSLVARRRAAEEALQRSVRELRAADEMKDEFLANISHELRTPLTSILGWARLIESGALDHAGIHEAAEIIHHSARSQQYLIEDLLDTSRIVFGKFRLDVNPVDLGAIARRSAALIRPAVEAKGLALDIDVPSTPCIIEGDERRIAQVITNFLSNAIKFTESPGQVTLRIERDATSLCVVVADTGEGIEPSLLPTIFQRFQQGVDGARRGGLGLGLAIARHVLEAHEGSIEAFSEGKGRGARFVARFPVRGPIGRRTAPTSVNREPLTTVPQSESEDSLIPRKSR